MLPLFPRSTHSLLAHPYYAGFLFDLRSLVLFGGWGLLAFSFSSLESSSTDLVIHIHQLYGTLLTLLWSPLSPPRFDRIAFRRMNPIYGGRLSCWSIGVRIAVDAT